MFLWFKRIVCSHEFDTKSIQLTEIPLPIKPIDDGYSEWSIYYQNLYACDAITKRVKSDCCKCDVTFYAHCGLDLPGKLIDKRRSD